MNFELFKNEDANKIVDKATVTDLTVYFGLMNVTSLPDDYFLDFTNVETLTFSEHGIILPSSLSALKKVKRVSFFDDKPSSIPNFIFDLPLVDTLWLSQNSSSTLDWSKELPRLATLLYLKSMSFYNVKSKDFLEKLLLLQQLEIINFDNIFLKKHKNTYIVKTLSQMKNLKVVQFDSNFEFCEELLQLDFLDLLIHKKFIKNVNTPSFLSLFEKTQLDSIICRDPNDYFYGREAKTMISFFQKNICKQEYNDFQKQIIFAFWNKNISEIKRLVSEKFDNQDFTNKKIKIIGKIKREQAEFLKEFLPKINCELVNTKKQEVDIYVVFAELKLEDFTAIVLSGKTFVLEDTLMDTLKSFEEHYLLEEENIGINDELIRLLASNQEENLLLAFQIMEQGGADITAQSILAAIYLAHPNKEIQKAVTKLYEKFCSAAYRIYAKGSKASLRISNNASSAMYYYAVHPDINRFDFILMYQKIAGDNPKVKDFQPNQVSFEACNIQVLPDSIRHFGNIKELNLSKNANFDFENSKTNFKTLAVLTTLNLEGCKLNIPNLSYLKSLKNLNLTANFLEETTWLGDLHLKRLNVENCKIVDWAFLDKSKNIEELNISNTQLADLPASIYELKQLKKLKARRNKIKKLDAKIENLTQLSELDLGINALDAVPFEVFDIDTLILDANKITAIDWQDKNTNKPLLIRYLNLNKNKISAFNISKNDLSNLKELYVSENELIELDEAIFTTADLIVLEANKNNIAKIPDNLTIHPNYRKIQFNSNSITILKKELLDLSVERMEIFLNPIKEIAEELKERKIYSHSRILY